MLALPPNRTNRMDQPRGGVSTPMIYHGPPPRQFALPAESETMEPERIKKEDLSFTQHMLRRKTPRGSILDAYDGTPDKNVKMPAAKHVLVSPSGRKSTYPHSERPDLFTGRNSAPNIGQGQDSLFSQQTFQEIGSGVGLEQRPAWDFPGGLDSVLNQTLPLHPSQRYYLHHGSTIPTVLPAAMQDHIGPTASAGPEVYGPYWPDGTFTPYRPAPVRDDRYYHRSFQQRSSNGSSLGNEQLHDSAQYLQHPQHVTSPRPDDLSKFSNDARFSSFRQHSHIHPGNRAGIGHLINSDQLIRTQGRNSFQAQPESIGNWDEPGYHSGKALFTPGRESNHMAFRDKTFTWAHRIYVDLLTSVHQSRKAHPLQYKGHGHSRAMSKPVIYPRPPKRSGSHFSTFPNHSEQREHGPMQFKQQPQDSNSNANANHYDLLRPTTAIFSPSHRNPENLTVSNSRAHIQSFSNHENDKIRTLRRTSDSAVYHYLAQQGSELPYSDARAALETIEALCNESNGDWVDGMLLAGCLAYGLGAYDSALQWYQGILQRDPAHVEAMSNLAATLLALNRREEALNHWAAAVKLRPGYFEAVEHLIGLLYGEHRAKEAVAIIELVERSLRISYTEDRSNWIDPLSDTESDTKSRSSSINTIESLEGAHFDHETEDRFSTTWSLHEQRPPGYGSGGYAIPGADNGRILALIHAKGNMLYALGDSRGAASAFEDAILVATGHRRRGIKGLIRRILTACTYDPSSELSNTTNSETKEPVLLSPERALLTAKNMFYPTGDLPGLQYVATGMAQKAAISTTSNSLLSLAKIYQDGMSSAATSNGLSSKAGTRDILALYYLSLSLQPSPSTANNVGILLAGVQQSPHRRNLVETSNGQLSNIPGVVPGSGIALALAYYNYGLNLDPQHAHLYTNLGSLLKDIGQLNAAIKMYEFAVKCDGNFDIALANLANAVKDQGRVADAITYYRRAVQANPDFAEAVCGLATALNSICGWQGRGGIFADQGARDRIHVSEHGMMFEARKNSGWISRVVEIVEKQLKEGETWGLGALTSSSIDVLCQQLTAMWSPEQTVEQVRWLRRVLLSWSGNNWEGSRVVRLVERAIRQIGWQWYQDRHKYRKDYPLQRYARPILPSCLTSPNAPTVLPFHTFTAPLSAKQIRQISQRNGLRISVSTLRSSWLPQTVYPPPNPPRPQLNVGYVSSDFNNHPLAHLMQSVFGLHDPGKVRAICYATTVSDGSIHRQQIEREAPLFYDTSSWSVERMVKQIVRDNVHILVNLNGYTRGARNEVFAARPAPIQMSFMGFAGTLGAEWCDYIYADTISIPPETLSPWRRNVDIEDRLNPDALAEEAEDWVYSENIIFAKDTFFCVDHKQSSPDSKTPLPPTSDRRQRERAWEAEQDRRWKLRKELFPTLTEGAVILGNFNQLYKIDPLTFRMYLRILEAVPNAILWLLRFPDLGEQNLLGFARSWAGNEIASRIIFTNVAPKGTHITRASVVDLFLDTPECNAHTTAADVVWSGTPMVTWGKWEYKMCSRMAGSIVASAFPLGREGDEARRDLLVQSEQHYEEQAIRLARNLKYPTSGNFGHGTGRLMDLRRMLWEGRWTSRLFDTKRWVSDLERAYLLAWNKWEKGEGGDIWL